MENNAKKISCVQFLIEYAIQEKEENHTQNEEMDIRRSPTIK